MISIIMLIVVMPETFILAQVMVILMIVVQVIMGTFHGVVLSLYARWRHLFLVQANLYAQEFNTKFKGTRKC